MQFSRRRLNGCGSHGSLPATGMLRLASSVVHPSASGGSGAGGPAEDFSPPRFTSQDEQLPERQRGVKGNFIPRDWTCMTTRDPWLPLPPKGGKGGTNETALNYQYFQVYLHQSMVEGRRSLLRTAEIVGRSSTLIEDLSGRCHWWDRAAAWDLRLAEIAVEERLRQVRRKSRALGQALRRLFWNKSTKSMRRRLPEVGIT
jgi:hypothetical protein